MSCQCGHGKRQHKVTFRRRTECEHCDCFSYFKVHAPGLPWEQRKPTNAERDSWLTLQLNGGWSQLPHGKRLRRMAHRARQYAGTSLRRVLLAVFVQRIRHLAGYAGRLEQRVEQLNRIHPRLCVPGCGFCAAISRARSDITEGLEYGVELHRFLFP